MTQIEFLTSEQVALIPEYQEKWQRYYLSTERIDRIRAIATIKGAYAVMEKPEPEVVVCESPLAALDTLRAYIAKTEVPNIDPDLRPDGFPRNFAKTFLQTALIAIKVQKKQKKAGIKPLHNLLLKVLNKPQKQIAKHIDECLPKDVTAKDVFEQGLSDSSFFGQINQNWNREDGKRASNAFSNSAGDFPDRDWEQMESQLSWIPGRRLFYRFWLKNWIQGTLMAQVYGVSAPPFKSLVCSALSAQENMFLQENPPIVTSELVMMCTFIDFANKVLKYPVPERKWAALQGLVKHCGWILAVDGLCVVCDLPTHIRLNNKYQFSGEAEPALQYSDGFSLYAHKGAFIPERFGVVPVSEWQVDWLFEERNLAWQNTLMKEFGAVRLLQSLPVLEIETFQDYRLLQLEGMGQQSDRILTRTDSATEKTYAVFVPRHNHSIQLSIQYAHSHYNESVFPRPMTEVA